MLKTGRPSLNSADPSSLLPSSELRRRTSSRTCWTPLNVCITLLGLGIVTTGLILRFTYAEDKSRSRGTPPPQGTTATPTGTSDPVPTTTSDPVPTTTPDGAFRIDVDNVLGHLKEFENIAFAHQRSRAVRLGYNASAQYVFDQLEATGLCQPAGPYFQYFTAPVHEFTSASISLHLPGRPEPLKLVHDVDFKSPRYNGHGVETGKRTPVVSIPGACLESDWDPEITGESTVIIHSSAISSGNCSWFEAAKLAERVGQASMLLVAGRFGYWGRVRPDGWDYNFGDPWESLVRIPVFTISDLAFSVIDAALALEPTTTAAPSSTAATTTTTTTEPPQAGAAAGVARAARRLPVEPTIAYDMEIVFAPTMNVFCDAPAVNTDEIVVIGAHLDSVPTAPGMDDNGSGSSAVLEIALQFLKRIGQGEMEQPQNRVRFAWWGAEEIGLIGSYWYARTLSQEDKAKHVLNINHDMLGAQNYRLGVHGARNVTSDIDPQLLVPNLKIQGTYEEYYTSIGQEVSIVGMTGGSDFLPFLRSGIPAGGLNTGTTSPKSEDEQRKFGGLVHYPHDICYHRDCDDFAGISRRGLQLCTNGAAYSIYKYATMENLRQWLWAEE